MSTECDRDELISQAMIRRVQRQNAGLKCACLAVGATLVWPFLFGHTAQDDSVVRAAGYEVADPQGTTRATFGMSKDNNPQLMLMDSKGKEQSRLTVTPRAAQMMLQNESKTSLLVEANEKESLMRLTGGDHGSSIIMQASEKGALISMLDQQETPRINLQVNEHGQPIITMWDKEKRVRMTWTIGDNGPSLQLIDANGEAYWEAKDGATVKEIPASQPVAGQP